MAVQKLIDKAFLDTLKGTWKIENRKSQPPLLILECTGANGGAFGFATSLLVGPSLRAVKKVISPLHERVVGPDKYLTPLTVERYEVTRVNNDTLRMTLAGFPLAVTWTRLKGPHLR